MFPLIPCGIPQNRHCGLVEQDLQLASRVSVNGTVGIEVHLAQGSSEASLTAPGKKRQDAIDEERLTILRSVPGYENRAKPIVREEHRSRRICHQLVITGAE